MTAVKGVKGRKLEASEQQAVLTSVKGANLDTVLRDIGSLQIKSQEGWAALQARIVEGVTRLQNTEGAVKIQEARLKELHDMDVAAMSLDALNAEIDQRHAEWETEQADRTQSLREQAAQTEQERKRNEAEYAYNLNVQRTRQNDEWNTQVERNKRTEALRQETMERGWSERESKLKEREAKATAMETQIATFPEQLRKAEVQAAAIAKNSAESKASHDAALLQKDMFASQALAQSRENANQDRIKALEAQITNLNAQLDKSREQAATVANEAFAAVSGRQVAETLTKVVSDQSAGGGSTRK